MGFWVYGKAAFIPLRMLAIAGFLARGRIRAALVPRVNVLLYGKGQDKAFYRLPLAEAFANIPPEALYQADTDGHPILGSILAGLVGIALAFGGFYLLVFWQYAVVFSSVGVMAALPGYLIGAKFKSKPFYVLRVKSVAADGTRTFHPLLAVDLNQLWKDDVATKDAKDKDGVVTERDMPKIYRSDVYLQKSKMRDEYRLFKGGARGAKGSIVQIGGYIVMALCMVGILVFAGIATSGTPTPQQGVVSARAER